MSKTVSLLLVSFLVGLCSLCVVGVFLIEPPTEIDVEYTAYNFDYIIPLPWYSQIDEIGELEFVDNIIPFYLYRSTTSGGTQLNFDLFLIDKGRASDVTANVDTNRCVVDERFAEKSGLLVGDEIVFDLYGTKQKKIISGILPSYPFSSRPTVFIEATNDIESLLMNNINHLSYSGAYVKVNNFQLADNYFYYKYYPLGKVGEPSWYENSETYEYMLNSITATTAVNEIISIEPLRIHHGQVLTDYYAERDSTFTISVIIICLWITLSWVGILLINNRSDEALLVLGYKISSITRRYIISFIVSGLIASVGSFLYMNFYNLTYAVIYDMALVCSIVFLCLIAHKKFYRKDLKLADSGNINLENQAKIHDDEKGYCEDIQQKSKLKEEQEYDNAPSGEDIDKYGTCSSLAESSSISKTISEEIDSNLNLEEKEKNLVERNCEKESAEENKK